MPKGYPNQHQQNNQNPAQGQAQHDNGNDAQGQGQQVNQNDPNQPQNIQNQQVNQNQNAVQGQGQQVNQQQQPINYADQIEQMNFDLARLQQNYFVSIDNRLSDIQTTLEQVTASNETISASIARLTERFDSAFGPDVDGPLSNTGKFIYQNFTDLNTSKIIPFFTKFIEWVNENTGLRIPPVNHYEKRDKRLLINKIDNYWDLLEPHLSDLIVVRQIKDLILNPH